MGRSQQSFSKREREAKKAKKKKEKEEKRAQRKEGDSDGSLENMMAYLDADGNIVDTPPDPEEEHEEINAEDIVVGVPKQEKTEPVRQEGRVSFFDHSRGFGFIMGPGKNDKYFVHQSRCNEEIDEGDKVTFDVEKGMKGLDAVNVNKA